MLHQQYFHNNLYIYIYIYTRTHTHHAVMRFFFLGGGIETFPNNQSSTPMPKDL